jgi:cytoskeletal protein RodZ
MAQGSGSSLLTLGIIGVVGYFVYEYLFAPAATTTTATTTATTTPATTTTTTPTTTVTAPATTTTPATTATPAASALDAIYSQMLRLITSSADPNFTGSGSALSGSAYHFNVYLQLAAPTLTIPDPGQVFGSTAAASAAMTAANYWTAMAPALKTANPSAGLSGGGYMGLGIFAGLGAMARGW